MMKQPCGELKNLIDPIHLVAGLKCSQNYHLFVSHKMIDQQEGFREEDSWEEEDSQEMEYLEEEEEVHPEPDPLEEDGGHRQFKYHSCNKENW